MKFKICMVGSYAVGKTSLVDRYVRSIYSDKYHTTIGVKIDKFDVDVDGRRAECIIWDIAGEDEFYTVRSSYLRGMRGYLLVLDGTRLSTVEVAQGIYDRVESDFDNVPYVLLINKSDLAGDWEISDEQIERLSAGAVATYRTSAKTGENVEAAFTALAQAMLNG